MSREVWHWCREDGEADQARSLAEWSSAAHELARRVTLRVLST